MGLGYDPDVAVRVLSKSDKRLGRLIARVGPFTLKARAGGSPFQALVRAIVYQQLSGKAAGTIYSRVLALFPGGRFPRPEQVLEGQFSEPARQFGPGRYRTRNGDGVPAQLGHGSISGEVIVIPGGGGTARGVETV